MAIVVPLVAIAAVVAVSLQGGSGPGSLPRGPHSFENLNADGTPVRWNPCQAIHYQVNLDNAPPNALADTKESIARVSSATGIRIVYDGPTTRTADQQTGGAFQFDVPPGGGRWDPLLISWVPHSHVEYLLNDPNVYAFARPFEGDGALSNE